MNRRKQREYTFRVVFSVEQNPTEVPLEDIDLHIESLGLVEPEDAGLIRHKVEEVFSKMQEMDELIDASSDHWSVDRIAKIELALLRVAIYDIKYGNVPVQVAINEAVELSKKYGEDQSSKFVNGVLGQIVKRL